MRRSILIALAALFLLIINLTLTFLQPAAASDEISTTCKNADGAYYQPTHFLRYEASNERVVLADLSSGDDLQILETALQPLPSSRLGLPYYDLQWSPDCHYALIMWGLTHANLYVWDAVNGRQVARFLGAGLYGWDTDWSPDSQQIVIRTRRGVYLWTLEGDQKMQLFGDPLSAYAVTWDEARGQVFASPYLFDRYSGQSLGYFPEQIPAEVCPTCFVFSDDGNKVVAYSRGVTIDGAEVAYGNQDYRHMGMTIWNRDGSSPVTIRTGADGYGYWPRVAFSPDDRYLAVAGRYEVRVWDLQNLPTDLSQPTYRFGGPKPGIRGIHFVDSTTVETTLLSGLEQRWNILTGEEVTEAG